MSEEAQTDPKTRGAREAARTARRNEALALTAPVLFVLLWSTGFIGAKLGLPDAEPLTFLTLRFALAAVQVSE